MQNCQSDHEIYSSSRNYDIYTLSKFFLTFIVAPLQPLCGLKLQHYQDASLIMLKDQETRGFLFFFFTSYGETKKILGDAKDQ